MVVIPLMIGAGSTTKDMVANNARSDISKARSSNSRGKIAWIHLLGRRHTPRPPMCDGKYRLTRQLQLQDMEHGGQQDAGVDMTGIQQRGNRPVMGNIEVAI